MNLAWWPLLFPLAALTLAGRWLWHMEDRHGIGPLAWRWHTGMPLDGHARTNATWLHRSSDVLHHSGHAVAWHHLPRLARAGIRCGAEAACLAALAGLILAPGITMPLLAVLAAAGSIWGGWRALRWLRDFRFNLRYAWPLRRTLALRHGIPPRTLKIARDRSRVRMSLPPGWAGTQRERDLLTSIVCSRLGLELDPASGEDVQWRERARAPRVTFAAAPPPPDIVRLADPRTRDIIAGCGRGEVFAGIGRRGKEIIRSVDTDSPHIGISMGSGDGKSVASGNAAAQLLAQGGLLAVLDYKIISHVWAKRLPNVAYASRPAQIHDLLMWLEKEIQERNGIVDAQSAYGRVSGFGFAQLTVIAEELNAAMKVLKRHWRECRAADRSLPAQSPAVEALEMLLFLGRQVNINVIAIGQRLSAAAVSSSGSADARENLGLRWMCDPGPATWRMLGPETPCPAPRDHPGRYYLVSRKEPLEVQGVYAAADGTDTLFRDLAVSGEVAVPPEDMPFVHRAGGYARAEAGGWTWKAEAVPVPELVSAGGVAGDVRHPGPIPRSGPDLHDVVSPAVDADLIGEAVAAGAMEDLVTLRDAVDLGIVKGRNLLAARRASQRDCRHPASVGKDGQGAKLYNAVDLGAYYAARAA